MWTVKPSVLAVDEDIDVLGSELIVSERPKTRSTWKPEGVKVQGDKRAGLGDHLEISSVRFNSVFCPFVIGLNESSGDIRGWRLVQSSRSDAPETAIV